MMQTDSHIFLIGDIKNSDNLLTREEAIDIIEDIQELMIYHKIIKIDVSIDPYKFPKELLNIDNL